LKRSGCTLAGLRFLSGESHNRMIDLATRLRMAAVRRQDTSAELSVQAFLRAVGQPYKLHDSTLPGSPDIVLRLSHTVIFVHGCFWHRHGCSRSTTPTARHRYWQQKFRRTIARDRRTVRALRKSGWKVIIVWECQARSSILLRKRLRVYSVGRGLVPTTPQVVGKRRSSATHRPQIRTTCR
jgi:DNA mismatch endonuclease (patch repair protein)